LSASEQAPQRRPEYIGFWKRLLATAIDFLIVFVIETPLLLAIYGREYLALSHAGYAGVWDFLIQAVLPAVAVILFWRRYGATPGKLAVGARIVDAASGGPPTTARFVLRYVAYFVSALPAFLGFVWIALDRRKQGWHDKIARTVVVADED
jgi:uncharacterized RDD family membrane protein YckC